MNGDRLKADNKKVEEVAVQAVDQAFAGVENILTHFDKNDKSVCIDGHIEVYRSRKMDKENLRGEIPVQIKGTCSKLSNVKKPKRTVNTTDLKRFRDTYKGVLYFVVYMDHKYQPKGIYFKEYLPYDIGKALDQRYDESQKTVTERFEPLPTDNGRLQCLCKNFLTDQFKQEGDKNLVIASSGDAAVGKFKKYEITKTFAPDEVPFSLESMRTGTYEYGISESGQAYVVGKLEDIDSIELSLPLNIRTGDFSTDMVVTQVEDDDGTRLRFGSFEIRHGETIKMNYRDCGTFHERLLNARIANGICKTGELLIGDIVACRGATFDNASMHKEITEHIELYSRYVQLLDLLHIKVDWDPSSLSDAELHDLEVLGSCLVDGAPLARGSFTDELTNMNVDIKGSRIKLLVHRVDDDRFELYDPMKLNTCFVIGTSNDGHPDEFSPVPSMLMLNEEDFRMAANIDAYQFGDCLDRYPITKESTNDATNKLLAMLNAYDAGAVCPRDLIECCELLARSILDIDPTSENCSINFLQVRVRKGSLAREERGTLARIAATTGDLLVRTSANILLGNFNVSEECIESMGSEEREYYQTWPIYNLMKHEPA